MDFGLTSGDSSGTDITFGQIQDVVIQVKFVKSNNLNNQHGKHLK